MTGINGYIYIEKQRVTGILNSNVGTLVVKGVAVAAVLPFQSAGINSTELDAPKADSFAADCDATFSEEIFDIAVAEIESVVEPDGVTDDVRRESVAFVCIHQPILPISAV
jgi:hypothetical protein